jgi:hypothetical protein
MQVDQSPHRNARRTDLHASADDRVQHPRCEHCHYTGRRLNVENSTCAALLAAAQLDLTPVQGMPTVVDFYFLPDMGRMT